MTPTTQILKRLRVLETEAAHLRELYPRASVKTGRTLSEADMLQLLADRHAGDVFVRHVRVHNSRRRLNVIDAVARTANSRLHAYEVKTSRPNWLAERSYPEKQMGALEGADYFWLVAPAGVVAAEELGAGIGLLVVTGAGVDVAVRARRLRPRFDALDAAVTRRSAAR